MDLTPSVRCKLPHVNIVLFLCHILDAPKHKEVTVIVS
jgi:hypothetical protein